MRAELQAFLAAVEALNAGAGWARPSPAADQALAAVYRHEPTARQVLRCLDPVLADFDISKGAAAGGQFTAEANARRGLGVLADMDAWHEHLTPDAPVLAADRLHPWVWDASRTFWDSGHHRAAVQAAASAINAHTQAKLGRLDVSDVRLMQETFSPHEPKTGEPRLRCPGDPADQTVQSRQRGALSFAVGCFSAIRNPASHEHEEWAEQTALECLAALSILARWISDWRVSSAPS
jgi:hypothetical protein